MTQKHSAVLDYYVLSNSCLYTHLFCSVADWFETKQMKPANGCVESYHAKKVWKDMVAGEQFSVNMLTKKSCLVCPS